jgi:hypothetical protein
MDVQGKAVVETGCGKLEGVFENNLYKFINRLIII